MHLLWATAARTRRNGDQRWLGASFTVLTPGDYIIGIKYSTVDRGHPGSGAGEHHLPLHDEPRWLDGCG
jgi:hypothetical protein